MKIIKEGVSVIRMENTFYLRGNYLLRIFDENYRLYGQQLDSNLEKIRTISVLR